MLDPVVVPALGETPLFHPGDRVRISARSPIGHYRVPTYLRGKRGSIEKVIEPTLIDNEEEGYGRNAGSTAPLLPHCRPDDRALAEIMPARRATACGSKCSRAGWKGFEHEPNGSDHDHHHADAETESASVPAITK